MDIEKFTDKARESIGEAQSIAAGMGHQEVDTGHLALALVRQDKGIVPNILQRMGVHVQAFDVALEEMLRKRPSVSGPGMDPSKIMITQRLAQVIKEAQDEAKRMQDEYVSVDHLFCALTNEPSDSPLGRVFAEYKITRVNFVKAMEELRGGADGDVARLAQDVPEIVDRQRHAHAEHDDAEHPAHIPADPREHLRMPRADEPREHDEQRHVVHEEFGDFLQIKNLLLLKRTYGFAAKEGEQKTRTAKAMRVSFPQHHTKNALAGGRERQRFLRPSCSPGIQAALSRPRGLNA